MLSANETKLLSVCLISNHLLLDFHLAKMLNNFVEYYKTDAVFSFCSIVFSVFFFQVKPKRILNKESHSKPLNRRRNQLAKRRTRSNKPNTRRALLPTSTSLQDYEISTLTDIRKVRLRGTRRFTIPSQIVSNEIRRIPRPSLIDMHDASLITLMDIRRLPLSLLMDIHNTQNLAQIAVYVSSETFLMEVCRMSPTSLMDIRTIPLSLLMIIRRTSLSSLMNISQCSLRSSMNSNETPLPVYSHDTMLSPADENQIPSLMDIATCLPTDENQLPSLMDIATSLPPSFTDSCRMLTLPSIGSSKRPLMPTPRRISKARYIRSPRFLPMRNHGTFHGANAQIDRYVKTVQRQREFLICQAEAEYDYYDNECMCDRYNKVYEDRAYINEPHDNETSNHVSGYERNVYSQPHCFNTRCREQAYDHMCETKFYDDRYYDNCFFENDYYDNSYDKCYENEFYHNGGYYGAYSYRPYHKMYTSSQFCRNDDYGNVHGYSSIGDYSEFPFYNNVHDYKSYHHELEFEGYNHRLDC